MPAPQTPYFPCYLHLKNGWTASISADDTPPAVCSVAAWPSYQDAESGHASTGWFDFGEGRTGRRCWSLADIRRALWEVEHADPPPIPPDRIAAVDGTLTPAGAGYSQPPTVTVK